MVVQSPPLVRLLESNKKWAADVTLAKPSFFSDLALGQSPKVLWIGCADSRVPESVVMACAPGDVFVHRNIANQFANNDASAISVLQYAVEHVGVEHVVVVGHTACGGALTCYELACGRKPIDTKSTLGQFLAPLHALASELDVAHAKDKAVAVKELIDENVRRQVWNLSQSGIIKEAWAKGTNVSIHGWVYDLETGLLGDLEVSQGPVA